MKNRDFNLLAKIVLVLTMIKTFSSIVNCIGLINIYSRMGANNVSTLIITIIFNILILIAATLTLKKKRNGLIFLIALFVLRMFVTIPWGGQISISYSLGSNFADLIIDFGLFAILMCFRKNGISGWVSMLASEDYISKRTRKNNEEDATLSHGESTVEEPLNNESIENVENSTLIEQENIEQKESTITSQEIVNVDNAIKKEKKLSKYGNKKILKYTLKLCRVLLLLLASFTVVVLTKTYPDYISNFSDKLKYTLNIPNNELANNLFEKAINSRHNSNFFVEGYDDYVPILSSYLYYDNPKEYIERDMLNKIYIMKDTVNQKSDIVDSEKYAINRRKFSDYKWTTIWGRYLIQVYDEWLSKDYEENSGYSKMKIIRLQAFDAKEAYAKEHSLVENATKIPIDDIDVINKIANYYEKENNYNKVVDIYESATKYNKNSPIILGKLAMAKYYSLDFEESRKFAVKALEKNSKETSALQAMAQLEADELNWREAKKYAKKAIDYGCENAEPYFIYAQAIYKEGEIEKAHEYYNKAYNINKDSDLANKYSECAGCPIEILSIDFGFSQKGTNVISQEELYSSKVKYVYPEVKINILRGEHIKVQCKFFMKGELAKGYNSPKGYTYEEDIYCFTPGITANKFTTGWGNDKPGAWQPGNHRFEIWYKGVKIGEEEFEVH